MIEIRELTKRYITKQGDVTALDGVDINIERGEIFGIIGPSGAGKSTLIRTINLLEKPTSGRVVFNGRELTSLRGKELRQQRQKIGMIFQHFNLLHSRTVEANIGFPLEIAGISGKERKERVERLMELVGLSDRAAYFPAQLSGGQKQRVGIARALASSPELLLSDEATSSLDPGSTDSILQLLARIRDELGLTILLITHEMEVVKKICDRMAVMEQGRVVERGRVLDIFSSPGHPLTKKFIKGVIDFNLPEGLQVDHAGFDHNKFKYDENLADGISTVRSVSNVSKDCPERGNNCVDDRRGGRADDCVDTDGHKQGEAGELIRVSFIGRSTHRPLISSLVRSFDLDANILYGKIDDIQGTPFGILFLKLEGDGEQIRRGIAYMKEKGLKVEVFTDGSFTGNSGEI